MQYQALDVFKTCMGHAVGDAHYDTNESGFLSPARPLIERLIEY